MKRSEQKVVQWGQVAVLLGMGLAFGVAKVLPPATGWENGLFEVAQNLFLCAAGLLSVWQGRQLPRPSQKALLWIAALFWFVFMGREMSWGAVLLAPSSFSDTAGPIWSSRVLLWYRPHVPPVVGGLLLVAIALGMRFRVWQALGQLARSKQLPWRALGVFALGFALASLAEGKGSVNWETHYGVHAVVLEEMLETLGYLALWLAQLQVFWALRASDRMA